MALLLSAILCVQLLPAMVRAEEGTAAASEGKGAFGYNARDDKYVDMFEAGIIDPTKVSRVALENAASIASMFLTTECVLAEKKSEQPAMPAMPAGGMGGMM